jgi:hypothetical protein
MEPTSSEDLQIFTLQLISTIIEKKEMDTPSAIVNLLKQTVVLRSKTPTSTAEVPDGLGDYLTAHGSSVLHSAVSNYYALLLTESCAKYSTIYLQASKDKPQCPHAKLCFGFIKELSSYLQTKDLFQYELKEHCRNSVVSDSKNFITAPITFLSKALVKLLWEDTTFLQQYRFLLTVYSYEAPGIVPDSICNYLKSV